MKIFKIFNPFIWAWNLFKFTAHLEMYRNNQDSYERYDFNNDTKYF